MNEDAFKQGFIKRAKEHGLSDEHIEELTKEAFAPLLPLLGAGARFAAPRILPFLGSMARGVGSFASRLWNGKLLRPATTLSGIPHPIGAIYSGGLKSMMQNHGTAFSTGMLGNEAINQLAAPPAQEQLPQVSTQEPAPQQQAWTNPFANLFKNNSV